jgi:hypothetical protein
LPESNKIKNPALVGAGFYISNLFVLGHRLQAFGADPQGLAVHFFGLQIDILSSGGFDIGV